MNIHNVKKKHIKEILLFQIIFFILIILVALFKGYEFEVSIKEFIIILFFSIINTFVWVVLPIITKK